MNPKELVKAKLNGWYRIRINDKTYPSAKWLGGGSFMIDGKDGFSIIIGLPSEFKVYTQLTKKPISIV